MATLFNSKDGQASDESSRDRLFATRLAPNANRERAIRESIAAAALAAFLVSFGAVAAFASAKVGLGAHGRARQLAQTAQGDFSNVGLMRIATAMDPASLVIARRYDPALETPVQPGLWVEATGGSYGAPPEFKLRDLSPQQAMLVNASMPFSILPNPAARPFVLKVSDPAEEGHALQCLTAAVYYEAASQDDDGEAAVAQVVLNRVRHPLFPKTVCGVVFQGSQKTSGCQFTFTCDGSLDRIPNAEGWIRAQRIAARALQGYVFKPVGEATHYHTMWVVPYWSPTLVKLTQVGAHIFYRWSGYGGLPGAFSMAYAGSEGDAWAMAAAKLVKVAGEPVTVGSQPLQVQTAELVTLQSAPMMVASAAPAALLIKPSVLPSTALAQGPQVYEMTLQHDHPPPPRIPVPSGW